MEWDFYSQSDQFGFIKRRLEYKKLPPTKAIKHGGVKCKLKVFIFVHSFGHVGEFYVSKSRRLGMDIDSLTLKEFTESEIICHCLNEMTYAGFDEKEIQAEFSKLKSIVDEYKALTPAEKAKHTLSHEELKKRISDKNLNSDE